MPALKVERAMIMSNEYDKVFPMDILPEYLLKAIIAFDIDKMENLGTMKLHQKILLFVNL